MWTWLKKNWPGLLLVALMLAALWLAILLKRGRDARAERAADAIEEATLDVLPEAVVAPARVERSSRGVLDQVETELDEANAPRPEDDAGGVAAGQRSDDAWRSGIERLRAEDNRY